MPPAPSRLAMLQGAGQSPWLDHLDPALIRRGGLKKMVDRDGLGGMTTSAITFERAVGSGEEYDEAIAELAADGLDAAAIVDRLMIDDVRAACDVLAPVYLASGGENGFVTVEVSPLLAHDGEQTILEAQRLFAAVDRPNVLVTIPATSEGVPAIRGCLDLGLNVNGSLLFTSGQYEAVADAYLDALEGRLRRDQTIRATSSLAGFSVAPIDAAVDELLKARLTGVGADGVARLAALRGRAGIAAAKVAYERFSAYLAGREWQLIAASGAKIQRVLWSDMAVEYDDRPATYYVDELIGEHTVVALSEATWRAFDECGTPVRSVERQADESHRLLREMSQLGIDLERLGARLQDEAIARSVAALGRLVELVQDKKTAPRAGEGG